jgi:hypothetical protein
MDRLSIRIVSEYKLPPICCACGEPSGPARFKVYASSWSRRQPFSVYFPLCPACAEAYTTVDNRRRLGCWAGVGLAFLAAVAGIVRRALLPDAPSGLILALFLGAILLGVAAYQVIPLFFPSPARASYRRILHAVQIKEYRPTGALGAGSMVLILAHQPFAEAFRAANEHLVIGERRLVIGDERNPS